MNRGLLGRADQAEADPVQLELTRAMAEFGTDRIGDSRFSPRSNDAYTNRQVSKRTKMDSA